MTMESNPNPLRGPLLDRIDPDPVKLARYRAEVDAMLEQNEKSLRWQKWFAGGLWVYCVLLATAFLVGFGFIAETPRWVPALGTVFVLLIAAAVELGKYFLSRVRLELLREIKGLELQVRALASPATSTAGTPAPGAAPRR